MRPNSVVHVRFNPAPTTSAGTADGALSLRAEAILALLALGGGASAGPLPRADAVFPPQDGREVALGRLLFYDPVLSGNGEVAWPTTHESECCAVNERQLWGSCAAASGLLGMAAICRSRRLR